MDISYEILLKKDTKLQEILNMYDKNSLKVYALVLCYKPSDFIFIFCK
jgi:hypothetical protein